MELKKNPKVDLRRYSFLFAEIGLALALLIMLGAFRYTKHERGESSLGQLEDVSLEQEIIPITRQQEVKPPPPPPPKVSEVLNIVEDDVEIEDELEIKDTEADQETEVEIVEIIEEEEEEEAKVFVIVENMPEFPNGGQQGLRKHIAKNVEYPEIAKENGIQGKVYVKFVVNQKGNIEQVEVARGVDPSLDKEAIRVIKNLPKWKPGSQRGKPVKVSFTVPIYFQLN